VYGEYQMGAPRLLHANTAHARAGITYNKVNLTRAFQESGRGPLTMVVPMNLQHR
jgi:hypothetical protein